MQRKPVRTRKPLLPVDKGYTFIELMVATSISMILITSLTGFYLYQTKIMAQLQSLMDWQQKVEAIDSILLEAIAMAGNMGCLKSSNPISVSEDGKCLFIKTLKNPHRLLSQEPDKLIIRGHLKAKLNDVLLVGDCEWVDTVSIESIKYDLATKQTHIVHHSQLSKTYNQKSVVGLWGIDQYYIADTGRKHHGKPIFALYKRDVQNRAQELVADVEKMCITQSADQIKFRLTIPEEIELVYRTG